MNDEISEEESEIINNGVWDRTLEQLLDKPICFLNIKNGYQWNKKLVENYGRAGNFLECIDNNRYFNGYKSVHDQKKVNINQKKNITNDRSYNRHYQEKIEKLIRKPLSPRKPTTVIGPKIGSRRYVDRKYLENTLINRGHRCLMSSLPPVAKTPDPSLFDITQGKYASDKPNIRNVRLVNLFPASLKPTRSPASSLFAY